MKRVATVALLGALAACATEEPVEVGYGDELGTPDNPVPDADAYAVTTRLAPGFDAAAITATVADIKAFAANPGRALLTLGGGPTLQELYTALPVALEDRLEGWLNTEIDKLRIGTRTARQASTDIASIVEVSLAQFTLESELTITPTGATHILNNLNFRPAGLDIVVPVGGLKADTLSQQTQAQVSAGGALALGEQRFSIAFGSHAWQGINLASTSMFGAPIETTLTTGIDCRVVAQAVAARCYNGTCVGHATQLEAVCRAGTGALVADLAAQVGAFQLGAFRFVRGTGRLVDDNANGEAERIVDGTWQAEVDIGTGMKTVNATFEALQ